MNGDRRKRGWFQRIFSNDPTISWSRIVATIVIGNVMTIWTAACIFGQGFNIQFTLEDMPQGLLLVLLTMFGGRVAQSYLEKKKEPCDPTSQIANCKFCGQELKSGSKFCAVCGNSQVSSQKPD